MRADEMVTMTSCLTDETLTAELTRLVASERGTTAAVIVHLAEFAARGLHLAAGFPSLFAYCTEALHLSEHEAYNRMEAARLAVRFPEVLLLIKEGALNLTTVRLLAPHLTKENKESLLTEASRKSKRGVEEVIVRYAPRPDVAASVRRMPAAESMPAGAGPESETPAVGATLPGVSAKEMSPGAPPALAPAAAADAATQVAATSPGRPSIVRPLAVDRYEIRFTATAETRDKLRLATDLLRHAVPDGDMAQVVDRALSALLEQLARQKFAAVRERHDRRIPGTEADPDRPCSGRHIPAAVKRAVWLRDGDRCAFVGKAGRRCNERGRLEFHHVRPYAVGGAATVENIQIRCRAHNAFEAEVFFGPTDGYADATGEPKLVPERVRWPGIRALSG